MKYCMSTFLLLCCLQSPVQAGPFVSEKAKDAAFYVLTTIDMEVTDGRQTKLLSTAFGGSSICISPSGHLLTCKHIADPLTVVSALLQESPGNWTGITNVSLRYRVENRQGLVFYTDYAPNVTLSASPELRSFGISVCGLESRSDCDDKRRNLRFFAHDMEADLMAFKIEHSSPLPYIDFAHNLNPPESQTIYAVSARKLPTAYVTAVLRPGFLDTRQPERQIINDSPAYRLLMTTISGDSGSAVVTEAGEIIGMAFANNLPEAADSSYMMSAETLHEFAIKCGAIAPAVPQLIAPPPPTEQFEQEEGPSFDSLGILLDDFMFPFSF